MQHRMHPSRIVVAVCLAAVGPVWADVVTPPIAMADRSGQDMALQRLDVRLAAHGPLSLTELDMVFRNDADNDVEGRFVCTLPAQAAVSRFAWELDGRLVEGEVVERQKAQQVYAASMHTGGGGALLDAERGNRFSAKVFPVRPKSTVRLLLSYSCVNRLTRAGYRTVEVPLVGLRSIEQFTFRGLCKSLPGERVVAADWFGLTSRVEQTGDQTLFTTTLRNEDFAPATNILFRFEPGEGAREPQRIVAGDYAMTVLSPRAVLSKAESEPDEWVVFVDTSASQAGGQDGRLAVVAELLRAIEAGCGGRSSIVVEAFDVNPAPVTRWRSGTGGTAPNDKAAAAAAALRDRGFMGSTNVEALLSYVGSRLRSDDRRRVALLVSDCIPSEGELEGAELLKALGTVPAADTLHVVVPGEVYDTGLAASLAERGRGRVVTVPLTVDTVDKAMQAIAELRRPEGSAYDIVDDGAEWVEPSQVRDVAPGDELILFSKLKPGTATTPSAVRLKDHAGAVTDATPAPVAVPTFAPLLEREAYRATIARLQRQMDTTYEYTARNDLKNEQIRISTKYRVLCPYTALLILKNDEDYERYGIDRNALADIMVVAPDGIGLQHRAAADLFVPTAAQLQPRNPAPANKQSFPTGRDPIIRFHAPADTRRVVAIFPWGQVKPMVRDPKTGVFQVRFIIPKAMEHGDYDVILVVTRGDGRKQRLVFSFRADKKAPGGAGESRAWRTRDGWLVQLSVVATSDATRVEALVPGGVTQPFARTADGRRWTTRFALSDRWGASVMVPVVLFDDAHNRMVLEMEVELR